MMVCAEIAGTAYTIVPRDHAIAPAPGAQVPADATQTSTRIAHALTCHAHLIREGEPFQMNPARMGADRVIKARDRTITRAEPTPIHACPPRDCADPMLEIADREIRPRTSE
jgi:hypothetical protein